MRVSKTISILVLASVFFLISTVISTDFFADSAPTMKTPVQTPLALTEQPLRLGNPILVGAEQPTHGTAGLPKGFEEIADLFQATNDFAIEEETREPASVRAAKASPPAKPVTHWSSATTDGFEYKIRVKNKVSAVWVLKRDDHYDLIFANNSGSRVNMTIAAEQFFALKNAATEIRSPASDLTKCKDSFIQLEMVDKKTRKLASTCLSAKNRDGDGLRQFGDALTAFVR